MSRVLVGGWRLWLWCCLAVALGQAMAPPASGVALAAGPAADGPIPVARNNASFSYLPILFRSPSPQPLPPPVPYVATPPIDFAAVRAELQQQGLDLAFNKIGFHTGVGGNTQGLDEWMAALDAAGVPIFLKSADNAEPLYMAQQLMQQSGVPHVLVFRRTGAQYDVPNYDLPPQEAAQQHWALHKAAWPPELDPSLVWIETINEVDKNRAGWLAEFALATAQLALADGYRWAAFGWSSGEPEPEHWESPKMLEFLSLAGAYPDRLAIALHEYSFDAADIGRLYPDLAGRFQALFQVCDDHLIRRPTILLTEWGWEPTHVPAPELAIEHIEWAAWLYAAYPQVKGAAIWYLGGGFGGIADEAQLLIAPVRDYSLSHYFAYTPGQGAIDPTLFQP
ncbi:MAG: hypothetical protein L0332_32435 [Chloroflexi bacterium]|nr:hypothetical protein [Chloroflexota bacterium]MCI0576906.1 hypothetical protein [Chloroflexota bacterium]MCI0646440.1 hypothetical protein [Chloroflexota bacterium]MCI0731412.1 hypothetical protein [Chloroflexota bacterium]